MTPSFAARFNCKSGGLLNELTANDKGQACWSGVGVKVGLVHRFIVGMLGIEV